MEGFELKSLLLEEEFISKIKTYVDNRAEETKVTIQQLNTDFNDGLIIIDDEYQRGYLYESKPKTPSKLVESVFMGVVIPEIQLFQRDDMKYELIDGQQRVLSLLNFYNNKFALKDLEVLSELNGFYYRDLPSELQLIFKKFNLNQRITKRNNEFKFDMFERLNTGSQQLNKQEVRNCIYRGEMMRLAKRLSENSEVQRTLFKVGDERGKRTEMVLRLLAIVYNDCKQLHGSAATNINKFLESESVKNISTKQTEEIYNQFVSTCSVINQSLDLESFFKRIKTSYGKASTVINHVECIFASVYRFVNKKEILLNSDKVLSALFILLTSDNSYGATTVQNSGAAVHTNRRISIVSRMLDDVVLNGISLDSKRNFSNDDKIKLWEDNLKTVGLIKCSLCGNQIHSIEDCDVDHIIPWSKGGQTSLGNAQLTHKTCNQIKSNSFFN